MRSSADSLEYAGDRAYKLSWCTGSRDVWQELEKQDLLLMASSALKATYDESQEGGRSDGVEKTEESAYQQYYGHVSSTCVWPLITSVALR